MRGLVLFCLLVSAQWALGQVSVTTPTAVVGLENVQQVGDLLLVDPASKPVMRTVGLIQVVSRSSQVVVKVTDTDRNIVPVVAVGDPVADTDDPELMSRRFIVRQNGKLWVRVTQIDFVRKIYDDTESTFTIGPAPEPLPPVPPVPPVPPTPNVPTDPFGNIGQMVAGCSQGLPSNAAVGAVYAKWGRLLKTDPSLTIDLAASQMNTELRAIPRYNEYAACMQNINAQVAKYWPMSRGVLGDCWLAVSRGFGVGN